MPNPRATLVLIGCLSSVIAAQPSRPTLLFDEGHNNFHTSVGSYRSFADSLRADGFDVRPLSGPVTREALSGVTILLSANPFPEPRDTLAQKQQSDEPFRWSKAALKSAYAPDEVQAVREWVSNGGALFLILDHAPHGSTAGDLARVVGVEPRDVETTDPAHQESQPPMPMVFTGQMLGEHEIMKGVGTVATFLGQSLGLPTTGSATALLRLADTAVDREWVRETKAFRQLSARGRAQAVAVEHGKGRAVVLGEAGVFADGEDGIDHKGSDNRRFGLNVARWLARRAIN